MIHLAFQWLRSVLLRGYEDEAWPESESTNSRPTTTFYPLSSDVFLVVLSDGWCCLSDMRRSSRCWPTAEEAIHDRVAFRQLTYGEELN